MLIVGLTGGIGSGKSEVARLFSALGVPVVDTDVIAHELTAPGQPVLEVIAATFGVSMLRADGALDRAALRHKVFGDPEARATLEQILHPRIREEALRQLAAICAPYCILVVPLLFEANGYHDLVGVTLVVDADETLQIERACRRSQLDPVAVKAIMAAQWPRQRRRQIADYVLENRGTLDELRQNVQKLHEKFMNA